MRPARSLRHTTPSKNRRATDAARFAAQAVSACALVAMAAPAAIAATGAARPASLQGTCTELTLKLAALPGTTITASTEVAAGTLKAGANEVPAHCLVTGQMLPRTSPVDGQPYAIGFEMRLPLAWNGRFFHQGNGGIDGRVLPATGGFGGGVTTHALLQGFAVLSSDAGHTAAAGPAFGIDPQARLDYGYQAVGKLTPMAKSVIEKAYGKLPDRSYFGGCSNGGRHALVAASRYADDYDGFVAGAPGFNLPKAAVANIASAQRLARVATKADDLNTAFTPAERQALSNAVLAKCDALDGATDGLIQDTAACERNFNFERDVPTCAGERDGSCLSTAQKAAIGPRFSGTLTSTGAQVYSSFPFDGGHGAAGIGFWMFTAPLALDSGSVGHIFKVPPAPVAGFNGPAFSLSANIDELVAQINATNSTYTESAMSFMTPPRPAELSTLKARGGKVLVFHGVSDAIFSANDTARWVDAVAAANGGQASSFLRYFPVPGMGHCSGGPATDQFDLVSAIVAWVEGGQAPERITASARGAGNAGGVNADLPASWPANRTRPLCAYPSVARYVGSGDVESAASFRCQ